MMVEFPGVGQNFPKLEENALFKLAKILKKTTRQYKFLFGELNKTFIFQTEAKPLKSRISNLDIQLKQ